MEKRTLVITTVNKLPEGVFMFTANRFAKDITTELYNRGVSPFENVIAAHDDDYIYVFINLGNTFTRIAAKKYKFGV